jgi:tRNA pseudouridine55 synthase
MFILIDKPKGITSHDVIRELRKITGIKKIGHAGTLDPNATGLLLIGIGRETTKQLGNILKAEDKIYEAEIILGESRTTDDVEGEVLKTFALSEIPLREIKSTLKSFLGEQLQTPPLYSALKILGDPAYKYARRGVEITLTSRPITIHSIELLSYNFPVLKIRTKVSSGTYIRSLARDIGNSLSVGGYLNNLNRIAIGRFDISNSVNLSKLNNNNWKEYTFK